MLFHESVVEFGGPGPRTFGAPPYGARHLRRPGCRTRRARSSRATALFVPGFMGSKEDFLPMLPVLSDAGVRVLAVDCRGQYETGEASADPSFSRADLARDLVAVARCVDAGPVHLLGHSYGGSSAAQRSSPPRETQPSGHRSH
ncbi:alpha/beta fold hydrolase [Streptomyces sp. M10(2022)]